MSEIAKVYSPSEVEEKWYARWLEGKAFAAHVNPEREPYCVMIPPPNVTGMLHMGHILNNTLQDVFIRRARLEGKEALWFPGTDHAGIATQTRVEKKLRAEGLHRTDLGRDKFLDEVWKWRDEHGGIILKQLQKLGASCDWDRTSFTLDERYSRAVLTAFVTLFKRGYIYRGLRMSNWCPVSQTALSNEEVNMKPQKGLLYKVRYEIVERPGSFLEVSTTRPETIMGDTAIAVHPDDERYADLVGLHVWRPFPRESIPIIADAAVQKDFGSGALKVTPAHDPVDFDIGQRHGLPVRDVLNPDGTISALGGEFAGLDRFEARKLTAKRLEELGLLAGTEDYENNVGFSERADVPVEPRLTEQWWLRYPKVAEAKRAVKEGILRFHPARWEKTYLHWLETMEQNNIDWCISRQLWWGHRIPVWYRKGLDRASIDFRDPQQVHVSVDGPSDPENWEQDEDVLDTWASSWLWPFANFGWPGNDPESQRELKYFYPTSTLVTGFDIIFLWVARMVMAGLEFCGDAAEYAAPDASKATAGKGAPPAPRPLSDEEIRARIPFGDVYITGLIRDSKRRKMSKSLGNSPDPLDLIAKFGADGMRFGILNIAPSGQDILFAEDRIEIGRNFCNKLWNACRFRQMSGEPGDNHSLAAILARIDPTHLDAYDQWILSRCVETTAAIDRAFERYEMHAYPHLVYEFFWSDYCDWYVEASKAKLKDAATRGTVLAVQDLIIRQTLLLLEPLMPFISEELWQDLGYVGDGERFLQDARIPRGDALRDSLAGAGIALDAAAIDRVEQVKDFIIRVRAIKAQYNVGTRRDLKVSVLTSDAQREVIGANEPTIRSLAGLEAIAFLDSPVDDMPGAVSRLGTAYLDLANVIDVEAEKKRLAKELDQLDRAIAGAEARLGNEKFVANAPAEVVEGARAQLAHNRERRAEVERLLAAL